MQVLCRLRAQAQWMHRVGSQVYYVKHQSFNRLGTSLLLSPDVSVASPALLVELGSNGLFAFEGFRVVASYAHTDSRHCTTTMTDEKKQLPITPSQRAPFIINVPI